ITSGGKRWRRYREERAVGIPRSYPPPHSKSIKLTVPALLLLDSVRLAAAEWAEAEEARKSDFLAHRGTRLAEAQALSRRGPNWAQEIAPAQAYLSACHEREANERR